VRALLSDSIGRRTGGYTAFKTGENRDKSERNERLMLAYSVEKLSFGAEAIFQIYGNATENPNKT